MIEKALLQRSIKRNAHGDFSTYMSRSANQQDVKRVLNYAAKKANDAQRQVAEQAKK